MTDPVFAQVLVEEIEKLDVKQSFFIIGGASMHLNHYFGASKEIATFFMHHEQACATASRLLWMICTRTFQKKNLKMFENLLPKLSGNDI